MKRVLGKSYFLILFFFIYGCNFIVNIKDEAMKERIQIYKRGFNFTSWKRTEYSMDYAKNSFDTMATSGANWVSIVVTLYQKSPDDTLIIDDPNKTPSIYSVSQIVQYAHSKNFGVMLKIHVDTYDDVSRTKIKPLDIHAWFRNYSKYVLNYARICEMLGVEMFCVGTELLSLSGERTLWSELIDSVRKIYTGKIIYASNFDEYRNVSFWDKVDYIGVDFFAPVSNKTDPVYDELVLGWQPYLNDLKNWFSENHSGKKLIFTEVGYPSTDGASMRPWSVGNVLDLEEQSLCYEVALDIISNVDFVDGIFFWNWNADLMADSLKMGFSPYGKPAFEVLKKHWVKQQVLSKNKIW
jgi:hypothetical protein